MQLKRKIITLFSLLIFLSACNSSIIESEFVEETTLKSTHSSTEVNRLALNETETAVIRHSYSEGILVDLQISKAPRNAEDRIGILNLTHNDGLNESQKYINLSDFNHFLDDEIQAAISTGSEVRYYCNCFEDDDGPTCWVKNLGFLIYCQKIACIACSLIVRTNSDSGKPERELNSSFIFLPSYF